jgi:hypothetical protein
MALPDVDSSVGHSFGLEFDGVVIKQITVVSLDPPIRGCGWWFLDAAQGVGGGRSRRVTRSRMSGG